MFDSTKNAIQAKKETSYDQDYCVDYGWTNLLSLMWYRKCHLSAVGFTTGPHPLSKGVLYSVRYSASSFNFRYPIVSLKSSSRCLRLLRRHPVTFIFPSKCFLQHPVLEAVPTQRVANLVILPSFYCMQDIPLLLDFLWYCILYTVGPSDLLQHHTRLYSKCSICFFLKFKSNVLVKSLLLVEYCFGHGNIGLNFTCTSCITCYLATQIVEIFQILRLFFIFLICAGDGWLEILIALVFYTFISIP
jgi:hypothetical protein